MYDGCFTQLITLQVLIEFVQCLSDRSGDGDFEVLMTLFEK